MAYRVFRAFPKRTGTPKFKIRWEIQGKDRNSQRHVPQSEWSSLGLRSDMTFEEAKEICRHINTKENLKLQEARRNNIAVRLKKEDSIKCAFLPEPLVNAFEQSLLKRFCDSDATSRKYKKVLGIWRITKRLIREVQQDPKDYEEQPEHIYNYCTKKSYSPETVKKLRRMLNLWGIFYAKRLNQPFLPLPPPSKHLTGKIEEAFFENHSNGMASEPLTHEMLQRAKDALRDDHYNWLYISVWFGLRPIEIDELHKSNTWSVRKEGFIKVLTVYQSKLTSVSRNKRWKLIPILFPEQEIAFHLIKAGNYSRPLLKTLAAKVGEGVTCYGGRKNFTDMMLERGYSLESISAWMGHSSIETTWQKYKNRMAVSIKKIGS